MKKGKPDLLETKVCKICGKHFIAFSPDYIYKLRHSPHSGFVYYCSYTCYRKAGGDSGKYVTNNAKFKDVL